MAKPPLTRQEGLVELITFVVLLVISMGLSLGASRLVLGTLFIVMTKSARQPDATTAGANARESTGTLVAPAA